MSGGNVQKVLVGREIAQSPAVLMTAYAVRGLDINTSYTIYNLLTESMSAKTSMCCLSCVTASSFSAAVRSPAWSTPERPTSARSAH